MRTCRVCGAPLLGSLLRCNACHAWNASDEGGPALPRIVNLASAEVVPVERLTSGPWDKSLGGGIVRTGAYLLGGPPGAGKTTLCLLACDALAAASNRPPLYIAAEQSLGEIRTNAERLRLECLDLFAMFEAMSFVATSELPFILSAMIREVQPVAVIVDSLPEFCADNTKLETRLLKSLKQDAVTNKCPVFVLAHVTKELEVAGLMRHQHAVDAVGVIEKNDKTDVRTLRWGKNRFGSTRTRFAFEMTETGIAEVEDSTGQRRTD
jgi:DNA repair protein RadA/Sms